VRTRKKKFHWSALSVLTTFFTIAMMGVASADQVQADSVVASPNIQNSPVTVNLSAGGSTTAQVGVQVKSQGSTHVVFPVSISAATTNLSGSTVSVPTPSSVEVNAYDDPGERKVTVTVTSPADADLTCGTNNFFQAKVTFTATTDLTALNGGNQTDFTTVNVNVAGPDCPPPPPSNTAPSVSAGGPYSGAEGSDIALSGTATDSDGSITATQRSIVSQNVSPGNCILSNDTSLAGATIECTDNGTATVRLTATDDDNASSSADAAVTITNANPVISSVSNAGPIDEGSSATITVSATDPGSADVLSSAYDCDNNGSYENTSGSCFFADDTGGPFTVGVQVSDDDGGSATSSTQVTVNNVPPTISNASFSGAVNCGTGSMLSVTFTDPGTDTWTADIDWDNNGTYDQTVAGVSSPFSVSHTYGSAGSHAAKVKVTDDDGGVSNTPTATAWVNYTMSGILQPVNDTRNGQPNSLFKYGSTIPVKVEVKDCDGSHPSNLLLIVKTSVTSSSTPPGVDDVASTSAADTGNQMRFSDPIYIYNLASKSVTTDSSSGVRIWVSLMNGNQVMQSTFADIGFKK